MVKFRAVPGVKPPRPPPAWAGRVVWVASRHGKHQPLARGLAPLGIGLDALPALDTDSFGTFSGEVERTLDPVAAARAKITLLRAELGPVAAMATEGSFGPHPTLPFLAHHQEVLLFNDPATGLDLVLTRAGSATNFAHMEFAAGDDPGSFLQAIGFPAAAVIIRAAGGAPGAGLTKGICDTSSFSAAWARAAALSPLGKVRVESDMRAHLNPLRRQVLARLGADLARRLATPCPGCGQPGFGVTTRLPGLPCRDCGTPTFRVRADRFSCPACGCHQDQPVPGAEAGADPGGCPACNP